MMKNKTTIILGGILIVITLLIFQFIIIHKHIVDYISISFILLSEIVATIGLSTKKVNVFEALSVSGTLIGYMIICSIVSLIFGRLMESVINWYILLHLLLIAVTAAVVICSHNIAKHNSVNNSKTESQLCTMRECEAVAQTLYLNSTPEHRADLRKVFEAVKYADKTSDVNSTDIMMALEDLKEACNKTDNEIPEQYNNISELAQKIISIVNERISYNNSFKHGKF